MHIAYFKIYQAFIKKGKILFFKYIAYFGSAEIMGNKNKPCFKKILFTHGYTNFKIRKRGVPNVEIQVKVKHPNKENSKVRNLIGRNFEEV